MKSKENYHLLNQLPQLYGYNLYGNFEGICTKTFKKEVIKQIAKDEFEDDIKEAKENIFFFKISINDLKSVHEMDHEG